MFNCKFLDLYAVKFSQNLFNHVLFLYRPKECPYFAETEKMVPVFYTNFGRNLVEHYFKINNEEIEKFCTDLYTKHRSGAFAYREEMYSLITSSHHSSQHYEEFYELCIKLSLIGYIARKKGSHADFLKAVRGIESLAVKAYNCCDLSESFDGMFNFACDLLETVLKWSGYEYTLFWDLKKMDWNGTNYFPFFWPHIDSFIRSKGMGILNGFEAVGSKHRTINREMFMFQIQEWCDNYYFQLGVVTPFTSLVHFLEASINISLLTVHALKSYPPSIRLAHESLLKLNISADRSWLFISKNIKQLGSKFKDNF